MEQYDYSNSHIGKGEKYDSRFQSPSLYLMWEQEKTILMNHLHRYNPKNILDLACGTGRISNFIAKNYPFADVTGVDISKSMLEVASKSSTGRITYIQSAIKEFNPVRSEEPFDFITCFRFFTNAQEDLRLEMIKCAARHSGPDTIFLLNNHQNINSLPLRLQNFRLKEKHGTKNSHIEVVANRLEFHLIGTFSLGITPQDEVKFLLGTKFSRRIEKLNNRFLSRRHQLGINQIMVFQMKREMQ